MELENKEIEFRYVMPRWHFWFLNLTILPLGLTGILFNKNGAPPPPEVYYAGWLLLVLWIVFIPVKTKQFLNRDSKIIFESNTIEIPTQWRGIVRIPYKEIQDISLVYRNTIMMGIKIHSLHGKPTAVEHDYFKDSAAFQEFLAVLRERTGI